MKEDILKLTIQWMTTSGIKLVIALVILIVGWKLIKKFIKSFMKILKNKNFDPSVSTFLEAFMEIALRVVLIISLLEYIGFNLAGLTAVVASAGLALGLALQGSLSHFAGGVLILILRPFKVGDYIESSNYSGTVEKISIFYTYLVTGDNKEVLIPNGKLANGSLINYSTKDTRRVDLTIGIGYEDDLIMAKNILYNILRGHNLILNEPEPFVAVCEQADSSLNFTVRAWAKRTDYWTVKFDLLETIKLRFDEEGINIPYPQMDLTIKNSDLVKVEK